LLKHEGTIVCMLAMRYKGYFSALGRTLIVAPTKVRSKASL
jgi:hypothetical protein